MGQFQAFRGVWTPLKYNHRRKKSCPNEYTNVTTKKDQKRPIKPFLGDFIVLDKFPHISPSPPPLPMSKIP